QRDLSNASEPACEASREAEHLSPHGCITVTCASWEGDPKASIMASVWQSVADATGTAFDDETTGTLSELLESVANRSGRSLLIIFDQFEDYLFAAQDTASSQLFDEELADAINWTDLPANFLISIREDTVAKLDRYQGMILGLFGNCLRLNRLS